MGIADKKKMIIIVGPTAVGKTRYAINIAKQHNTEIISADSRQCFKELNIGVARPSEAELQEVPHHFIATHSIHDAVTAADFELFALMTARELFKKKDQVVMVGGTGLYIKAFCEGLDKIPAIPDDVRNSIINEYETQGISWLVQQLRDRDPEFAEIGEMQNPQRMMRALEVIVATGNSIIDYRKGAKASRDFEIEKIGLELPREILNERINTRVDQMMEAGLLEEVSGLFPNRNLNALQTVGYAELFEHLDGKISLHAGVELIKQHTRQYAKRQMTWFKRDEAVLWHFA